MAAYADFDSLPKVDSQPHGNAWGIWGKDDELGTKEIKAGISVQLDLRLDHFNHRVAGREPFQHSIVDFKERHQGTNHDFFAHDDVLTFNTQSSSQWDGFRHVGIQKSGKYYNDMKHRAIDENLDDGRLGIHKWVEKGGIVGRGVLLDYHAWRQQIGKPEVAPNSSFSITVDELDAVAKYQDTKFRPGDILIIRTGFTLWHQKASKEEQVRGMNEGAFIGLESSMQSVKWLWNHHFAAVAADTLGFECTPIGFSTPGSIILHEWLLDHWGTPIGELWGLEELARVCRELKQWSFFLTSAPLHVFGGVATPPNVIAVL